MELLLEITGWAGAAATLSAYLTVSMNWLKAGIGFQTANLLGACAFMINGTFHQAWPSVATNVAWFLISAVALFRLRRANQKPTHVADRQEIQFPGVCDSSGQHTDVEVDAGRAY